MQWIWSMLVRILLICPAGFRKHAAARLADYILHRYAVIEVKGAEILHRYKGKNLLFISNHLSNSDAIVLDHVLKSFNPVFLAGIKLKRESGSRLMLSTFNTIPIDPEKADRHALFEAVEASRRGNSVLIFPEGTRSRTASMIHAKKGIILLAKMVRVPVIPVAVEGTEHLLPINDEDMNREFFRKANVKVTIGEPLEVPPERQNESKRQWEERVLDYYMRGIAGLLSPQYRGVYS